MFWPSINNYKIVLSFYRFEREIISYFWLNQTYFALIGWDSNSESLLRSLNQPSRKRYSVLRTDLKVSLEASRLLRKKNIIIYIKRKHNIVSSSTYICIDYGGKTCGRTAYCQSDFFSKGICVNANNIKNNNNNNNIL